MAYNEQLAGRVRDYLQGIDGLPVEERKMFRGLAFLVHGKMCVNVSGDKLMCRFDPAMQELLMPEPGFEPLFMKGKLYHGYCYVAPGALQPAAALHLWVDRCLAFNSKAQSSKKKS